MEIASRLKLLIESGKTGCALYDEIDQLLPQDYEGGPELDEILTTIENRGIGFGEELLPQLCKGDELDDPIKVYLREMNTIPRLTRDREIELAKLIEGKGREGERAEAQLVEAHLTRVVSIAQHYSDRGVHILDLIEKGNIALLNAMRKFNYRRGYKFSTYASWWIHRSIVRALDT